MRHTDKLYPLCGVKRIEWNPILEVFYLHSHEESNHPSTITVTAEEDKEGYDAIENALRTAVGKLLFWGMPSDDEYCLDYRLTGLPEVRKHWRRKAGRVDE